MTTANCGANDEFDFRLIFGEDGQPGPGPPLGPAGAVPAGRGGGFLFSSQRGGGAAAGGGRGAAVPPSALRPGPAGREGAMTGGAAPLPPSLGGEKLKRKNKRTKNSGCAGEAAPGRGGREGGSGSAAERA